MHLNVAGFRSFTRFLWGLVIALAGLLLLLSLRREFGHDEFEAIHTAWKIFSGEQIYTDFFQHHHPFFYYILIAPIAWVGENTSTVIASRLLVYCMTGGICLFTYYLARQVYRDRLTGILAVLFTGSAFIFADSAIEVRPDVPQVLFGTLAIFLLFGYLDDRRIWKLCISAASLAISFLFLQKSVFVVAGVAGLLAVAVWRKHVTWSAIWIYAGCFAAALLPYFVYLLVSSTWDDYVLYNWRLNMLFLNRFSAWLGMGMIFRTSTVLLAFYVLGFVQFCNTVQSKRLRWLSLWMLASVFLVRAPYNQYFMPAIPLMAIVAARAFSAMIFEYKRSRVVLLLASAGLLCFYLLRAMYPGNYFLFVPAILFIGLFVEYEIRKGKFAWAKWGPITAGAALLLPMLLLLYRAGDTNTAQLELVRYVLAKTESDDYVYDGDIQFNLFRKDIDYFWFSVRQSGPRLGALATYQKEIEPYDYNIYEAIGRYEPALISSFYIPPMDDPGIARNYVQSEEYEFIYLRKN